MQRQPVQVPEGNPGSVCRVGHTADGRFLACGNGKGDVYVYDAIQGDCITHLRPRRVRIDAAPCRAGRCQLHRGTCGAGCMTGSMTSSGSLRGSSRFAHVPDHRCCSLHHGLAAPGKPRLCSMAADTAAGCALQFQVPVRSCAVAEDCGTLLATSGKGFFFRYKFSWKHPKRDKWDHLSASESSEDEGEVEEDHAEAEVLAGSCLRLQVMPVRIMPAPRSADGIAHL